MYLIFIKYISDTLPVEYYKIPVNYRKVNDHAQSRKQAPRDQLPCSENTRHLNSSIYVQQITYRMFWRILNTSDDAFLASDLRNNTNFISSYKNSMMPTDVK